MVVICLIFGFISYIFFGSNNLINNILWFSIFMLFLRPIYQEISILMLGSILLMFLPRVYDIRKQKDNKYMIVIGFKNHIKFKPYKHLNININKLFGYMLNKKYFYDPGDLNDSLIIISRDIQNKKIANEKLQNIIRVDILQK